MGKLLAQLKPVLKGGWSGVPGTWEEPWDLQGLQGSLRDGGFAFIYCSSAIFASRITLGDPIPECLVLTSV